jgi:hypothetical protein
MQLRQLAAETAGGHRDVDAIGKSALGLATASTI